MQILIKDPSFIIRYWNWTNTDNRTSIFSFNKLGSNGNDGNVNSKYYGGNNWKSVFWFPSDSTKKNQICNHNDPDGIRPIICCPFIPVYTHMDICLNHLKTLGILILVIIKNDK